MSRVKLLPVAIRELAVAASWYEEQGEGLGVERVRAVELVATGLSRLPERHPVVARRTRRARVPRFPYFVLFVIENDVILIIALLHGRSDPQGWVDRVHERETDYAGAV